MGFADCRNANVNAELFLKLTEVIVPMSGVVFAAVQATNFLPRSRISIIDRGKGH
jgi:hypothetical protein